MSHAALQHRSKGDIFIESNRGHYRGVVTGGNCEQRLILRIDPLNGWTPGTLDDLFLFRRSGGLAKDLSAAFNAVDHVRTGIQEYRALRRLHGETLAQMADKTPQFDDPLSNGRWADARAVPV